MRKYGYAPCARTLALCTHATLPITFTFVFGYFGVKYTGKHTTLHLLNALKDLYTDSVNYTGTLYCGLTINWNYRAEHVDISMPNYISQALHKFKHSLAPKREDAPHKWICHSYGAKKQFSDPVNQSPRLPLSDIKHVQTVVGTLLYYAFAVDNTILVALDDLASEQTQGTQKILDSITQLLKYAATHPNSTIRYRKINMVLHIHSDGSYLSALKDRSRAGGHFFLSSHSPDPAKCTLNGPIHLITKILRNVMVSAAEA